MEMAREIFLREIGKQLIHIMKDLGVRHATDALDSHVQTIA
jgi:hypothetical protein